MSFNGSFWGLTEGLRPKHINSVVNYLKNLSLGIEILKLQTLNTYDINAEYITLLNTPTATGHVVHKGYIDGLIAGIATGATSWASGGVGNDIKNTNSGMVWLGRATDNTSGAKLQVAGKGYFEDNLMVGNSSGVTKFVVTVGGNTTVGGWLGVTDISNLNGGIAVDTNKFTVSSGGNVGIAGSLSASGAITFGSNLGVTGISTLSGLLNANGGIAIGTDKFTVSNLGVTNVGGKLTTVASAAVAGAGFNIPPGIVPDTPINGDIWSTTSGVFARVNGATIQFGDASANGTVTSGSITSLPTGITGSIANPTTTPALTLSWATTGMTNYNVLQVNGSGAASFAALANSHLPVVDAQHGGTGQSVYAIGDILYANSTTTLTKLAKPLVNTNNSTKSYVLGFNANAPVYTYGPSKQSIVIATSNSPSEYKATADFLCTGTNDQLGINAMISIANGANILLSPGTYNISASIMMYGSVKLQGHGDLTKIATTSTIDMVVCQSSTYSANDCVISDIHFINTSSYATSAIKCVGVTNILIERCKFENLTKVDCSAILFDTTFNSKIINNYFTNIGSTGTTTASAISLTNGGNNNIISNNKIKVVYGWSIYLSDSHKNNIVSNNITECYGIGICLSTTSAYNILESNYINIIGALDGISSGTGDGNIINGNNIIKTSPGVGGSGISLNGIAGTDYSNENIITSNRIFGFETGIKLYYSNYIIINSNKITSTTGPCIYGTYSTANIVTSNNTNTSTGIGFNDIILSAGCDYNFIGSNIYNVGITADGENSSTTAYISANNILI